MKKSFLLLVVMAFAIVGCHKPEPEPKPEPVDTTTTQEEPFIDQLPDGSFENSWVEFTAEKGKYLDFKTSAFTTLNILYELPDDPLPGKLTAFRTNDAQDGQYAIKLVTADLSGMILVPGAFGTISRDCVGEFLNTGGITIKKEFSYKPVALTGYYKYEPVNGDSAVIDMAIYSGNKEIASALLKEKNTVSEWTPFTLTLNYTDPTANATHLKLLFIASACYDFSKLQECQGQVGSTLYIDNLKFVYE